MLLIFPRSRVSGLPISLARSRLHLAWTVELELVSGTAPTPSPSCEGVPSDHRAERPSLPVRHPLHQMLDC